MGKSAPEPPDPKETSAASTGTNVSTAIANAFLQNPSEVGPDGSTRLDPTGTFAFTDPYTGITNNIPTFTRTTSLSPEQQAIKAQQDAANLNLGKLANQQSSFLTDYLGKPVDLSNEATESRLFDLGRKRLDPMFAEQQNALAADLANKGIMLGSKQYDTAQRQQSEKENDAYNQLLLQGRGQAVQEALTQRNQPINEITALLSGSQVDQPNFLGSTVGAIPTTDTAGLINENYNQKLGIWQQQNQMTQGILGGLFGLGAKLIGLSDLLEKVDVKRIGTLDNGLGVYSYRYRNSDTVQIGVLAQEVEAMRPDAVFKIGSTRIVDYERAVA